MLQELVTRVEVRLPGNSRQEFSHLDDLRRAYDEDASYRNDASFHALAFPGFEVVRREILTEHLLDGLHPQLLVLRSVL